MAEILRVTLSSFKDPVLCWEPVTAYWIEDIALYQLEVALRLYFGGEEKDYLSVITLAGAAEDILGQLVTAKGQERPPEERRDNAIESLKRDVVAVHEHVSLDGEPITPSEVATRANRARNRLKHWDAKTDGRLVKHDFAQEARDMLFRAIENYWMLKQELSPAMQKFQREISGDLHGR